MIRPTLLFCILATTAHAQETAQEHRLIAAIEAAGCVVTEANEAAILAAAQLDENVAMAIVKLWMSDGRAIPQDDDLRLVTGACK